MFNVAHQRLARTESITVLQAVEHLEMFVATSGKAVWFAEIDQPKREQPIAYLLRSESPVIGKVTSRVRDFISKQLSKFPLPAGEVLFFGFGYRDFARIVHARVLWVAGLSNQATAAAHEILEGIATVDHAHTRCAILIWGIRIYLWDGDLDRAEHYIMR